MLERDADGFSVNGASVPKVTLKAPPPMVSMPAFFDGCASSEEAVIKMINELGQPLSVERDGFDAMYRCLADALILLLANQGGLAP